MTLAPADGGRRSRRGFLYQDAVTLLDCLDMLDGRWTEVSWEDLEDILCFQGTVPVYRQVKTVEGPGKSHSIARVCQPDSAKSRENRTAETSYLGKLFIGKPLPEGTRFTLIVNETPAADLYAFACERGRTRDPVSAEVRQKVIDKLDGLSLPDERDVGWCVDRLDVLVEARTSDQVEDEARRRLTPMVRTYLGQEPLVAEVDEVLKRLISVHIGRKAAELRAVRHTVEDFRAVFEDAVQRVTGQRHDGGLERLMTLQEKLRPAGVLPEEADRQHEAMLAFRRHQRSSLGSERQRLADLSDKIYAICQVKAMQRRGGMIIAGEPAYRETVLAVCSLPEVLSNEVPLSQALAVLSDITARCQNRYEDAS
ncbi:dsDNA nuclease domain-containing protein (plasmid) [Streptomyces sp. JL4002]|uniref:dsDNA nuclease domain-containing protein n=1 Tax=Streptomyces sp. JL4002 TaxID=3404781 RepID=UPI003B283F6B